MISKVYGNTIKYPKECATTLARTKALGNDKNRFVQLIVRLAGPRWWRRLRLTLKGFDDYQYNTKEATWIITLNGSKGFIRKVDKFVKNPQPWLDKWKRQIERKRARLAKKLAKREKVEDNSADGKDTCDRPTE